jgi:hypothetical protein
MPEGIASVLDQTSIAWFSLGLGAAFAITMLCIMLFMFFSYIDHGFLGLIILLSIIFFLIGFSFLVAASAKGLDIKVAVMAVDALVLLGSKLLAPRFLEYLESGDSEAPDDGEGSEVRPAGSSAESPPIKRVKDRNPIRSKP